MKKIEEHSSIKQTYIINELLNNSYNRETYTIYDIMKLLPSTISVNGHVGYLRISNFDIVWSSLESEMNGSIILMFQYLFTNENIFDGYIKWLQYYNEHKDNVKIIEE